MSKYKDWKMTDWIALGFVGISFIVIPDFILDHNWYELPTMATVYDYPYNIPIIESGIFLIYCSLSGVYWIKNKKNKYGNSLLLISNHIYNTSYAICYCI